MTKTEEIKTVFKWDIKQFGLCEAFFTNGKFDHFQFSHSGFAIEHGCWTNDLDYLMELRDVLIELFEKLDKENQ